MEVYELLVLIAVLGTATISDIRFYKIPNWCILLGIIAGICMHPQNILKSLIQMVVIFIVFYPFYRIKGLGAGDIKLIMMLGCYFDKDRLMMIVLMTFAIGAIVAIGKIVFKKEARQQLKYGFMYLRKVVITKAVDPYICNKTNKQQMVRLALPIFIATVFGGIIK